MNDYKKKYNESMLRADEAVQKGFLDKATFDIIFPPEESDDERIRKSIIALIKRDGQGMFKAEQLAWIEKQKNTDGDFARGYDSGYANCLQSHGAEWFEKQKEWSAEDEKKLDAVCELLENTSAIHPNYSHRNLIIWLNSFRPQKNCSDCAKHLEGYISGRGDAENKLLDQFGVLITPEGELHMKPRWSPSEDQMKDLLNAENALRKHRHIAIADKIEELHYCLEQLKKSQP